MPATASLKQASKRAKKRSLFRFLAWTAAASVGVLLSACGGGDAGTPAEAGKRPQAAVAPLGGSVPAARPLFGAIDAYARTDLNGDGRTDLVWVDAARGITAAWLMNGATLLGGGTLLYHPIFRVIGTGDLGGDGKSDLLWYDSFRDVTATWQMDGTRLAAGRELLLNQGFELIGTPDIDGDGKDDLLWYAERTGRLVVWRMDGTSTRSTLDLTYLVPISTTTRVVALPDLDGDGRTDLVLRDSATGATFAWLMNAAGGITPVPLLTHPDFRVTHAADMNGDGKSDLLWHNPVTGQTVVWLMDGANLIGGGEILADRNYRVLATPDLNGDGRADLLWTSVTQRQTVAWLMNGTTLLGGGVLPAAAGFEVVGIPDLDGDGRADLLWYDASTGQTAVWLMNGSAIGGGGTLLTDAMFRPLGAPPAFPFQVPGDAVFSSNCTATPAVAAKGPFTSQAGDCFLTYRWTEAEMAAFRAGPDETLRRRLLDDVRQHLDPNENRIDTVIAILDNDGSDRGNLAYGYNYGVQPCSVHDRRGECSRFARLGHIWLTGRDDLAYGPALHELAHGFHYRVTRDGGSNFLVPTTVNSHWGFSSVGGQLGGWDKASLTALGDGRYRARAPLPPPVYGVPTSFGLVANGGNSVPYGNLELWMMGLLPDELLDSVDVAENAAFVDVGVFTASAIRRYTPDEIIARTLPNARPSSATPRAFRGVVVFVTTQAALTPEAITRLNGQVEYFSRRAASTPTERLYNFWEATGGRASLHLAGASLLMAGGSSAP